MSRNEFRRCITQILMFVFLVPLGAMSVTGCGELEQGASYKQGKYRGKTDGRPWDSQPAAYVSGERTKGDEYSWEKQIRARNDGQNENRRIGD